MKICFPTCSWPLTNPKSLGDGMARAKMCLPVGWWFSSTVGKTHCLQTVYHLATPAPTTTNLAALAVVAATNEIRAASSLPPNSLPAQSLVLWVTLWRTGKKTRGRNRCRQRWRAANTTTSPPQKWGKLEVFKVEFGFLSLRFAFPQRTPLSLNRSWRVGNPTEFPELTN